MKIMNPKLAQMGQKRPVNTGGPVRPVFEGKPFTGGPRPMGPKGFGTTDGGPSRGPMAGGSRPVAGVKPTIGGMTQAMAGNAGKFGGAMAKQMGMKSGGSTGSASKRADGIASKGKTKGRMC